MGVGGGGGVSLPRGCFKIVHVSVQHQYFIQCAKHYLNSDLVDVSIKDNCFENYGSGQRSGVLLHGGNTILQRA